MKIKQYIKLLKKLNACGEAIVWSKQFKTSQEAWDACERGDWMLWLLGKLCGGPGSKSRKRLVLTACKCARLAWEWMPKESKAAIRTAENYANGKKGVELEDVKKAATAADYADCFAAYFAACAAVVAAYAVATVAASDARKQNKRCADIVRKDYPKLIINE